MLSLTEASSPMTEANTQPSPLAPEITVDVRPYLDKPMAVMAMVRRALQKANHHAWASQFTEDALASAPDTLLEVVQRYVTVP